MSVIGVIGDTEVVGKVTLLRADKDEERERGCKCGMDVELRMRPHVRVLVWHRGLSKDRLIMHQNKELCYNG